MERLEFAYHPDEISVAYIAFFTEVTNAAEIKERLLASLQLQGPEGEQERKRLNFAFIDAKGVSAAIHIKAAVAQATLVCAQQRMVSRSLNTEILWFLSPGKSIRDALVRYGVSDTTTTLIAVQVGPPSLNAEEILANLNEIVNGRLTPLEDVKDHANFHLIRQYHGLLSAPRLRRVGEKELDRYTGITALAYTVAKSIVT